MIARKDFVAVIIPFIILIISCSTPKKEQGLAGYWRLRGDSKDYSGNNNHGINHGVDLDSGKFNGTNAFIEVPAGTSLRFGTRDFAISAWINADSSRGDIVGDILEMYDPAQRKGLTLSINSSAGGYVSQSSDRMIYFGIDNAKTEEWQDCGRPSATSNYVSNSLTVYKGQLYAAIMNDKEEKDWAHVYRYDGGQKWVDCGRVGDGRTPGVGPLIVHNGELYAVTGMIDWTRVNNPDYDAGRVFKYKGGTEWEEYGEPSSENRTLNPIASYKGKLFVGAGPATWGVYTQSGDKTWQASKIFSKEGPQKCFPHCMRVYREKLFTGFQSIHYYDGTGWTYAGLPAEPENTLQAHSMTVFRGNLLAGTWPHAKVAKYLGGEKWEDLGRVGEDGTEVNSLVVYNGKLYGGSIPRSEVCRYDGDSTWTSLKRFYSPENWTPAPPVENSGNPKTAEVNEWSRLTSMTVFDGKLFASTGSCTSSPLDAPADVRGKVFSMQAGRMVSYDHDIGNGWKHITATRDSGKLNIYVNGELVKSTENFTQSDYDISTDQPLRIGFGQSDYFHGRISEVKMYNRALTAEEIKLNAATQSWQ